MAQVDNSGFWFFFSDVCYFCWFVVDLLYTDSFEPYNIVVFAEGSFVEIVVMRVMDEEAFSGIFSVDDDSFIPLVTCSFKGLAADGGVV